jgi:predicted anti-sigma-YlaC factor YlaD
MFKRLAILGCRQANALLSQRMDAPLGPLARTRLQLHLKLCKACSGVDRQFALMRDAVRRLDR